MTVLVSSYNRVDICSCRGYGEPITLLVQMLRVQQFHADAVTSVAEEVSCLRFFNEAQGLGSRV